MPDTDLALLESSHKCNIARKSVIEKICSKRKENSGVAWDLLLKRLVVDVEKEMIFCHIPHVGEVQSKNILAFLEFEPVEVVRLFN